MPDSTTPALTSLTWARLTRFSGKDRVFARDLFAREAWATLAGEFGDDRPYGFAEATALMWVRPDAFAAEAARNNLAGTQAAGFRALAVRPVRMDRCGVRARWAYMYRWATVERLWLFDALVAMEPGLLVPWADDTGGPAPTRLMTLKGSNAPHRRTTGVSLREVAGSPNAAAQAAVRPGVVMADLMLITACALVGCVAIHLLTRRVGR
ncbi:hypothetical protein [Streptomyces telluris]|uniref:Uncharacterized protein n=1 Tax=Streptomyces telluris TaxID=2720021 RepID=A0A9X2LJ12_9ACTN|nr:hypothetical protein [Streptomyces telluris]MCQ8772105.1 hypothetical protein [Streptomyces telluris]NJP82252.1 hypothetical protein [Streptomyces telluris]